LVQLGNDDAAPEEKKEEAPIPPKPKVPEVPKSDEPDMSILYEKE